MTGEMAWVAEWSSKSRDGVRPFRQVQASDNVREDRHVTAFLKTNIISFGLMSTMKCIVSITFPCSFDQIDFQMVRNKRVARDHNNS